MAILGRAIQDRFPNYYRYFSTRSFEFRGHAMRNHNKLLGAVEGVDGIKTGYTNASGFNLVTSVRRGGRHIVAAVFGGRTASWRDSRMLDLIQKYFSVASAKRTAPTLAEAKATGGKGNSQGTGRGPGGPLVRTARQRRATRRPMPGSTDPIKPIAVKTVLVKAASLHGAALTNCPARSSGCCRHRPPQATPVTTVATVKTDGAPAASRTPRRARRAAGAIRQRRRRLARPRPATAFRLPPATRAAAVNRAAARSSRSAPSTTKPKPSCV